MSSNTTSISNAVADMRREFDSSFAAPPSGPGEDHESLITIRVAGEAFAVRTAQITGLAKLKRIVPVPSRALGLLGITAARGALFPAYDVATLLDLSAAGRERAWIMFSGRETPVALVFDQFEGQVEIDRSCLIESDSSRSHPYRRQMARVGANDRAVIDIPGLVEAIRKSAGLIEPAEGIRSQ